MEVKIEGLRGLHAALERAAGNAGAGAEKGLQKVGLEIVAEAKKNLNQNKANNTGTLRSSGRVQKAEGGLDAGFFSEDSSEGYAAAVEYGRGPSRRAGTIPLRTTIKAWVHRKLGVPYGKELDSAAFLISRKIHRQGTKPQPFFTPAVRQVEDRVQDIINNSVEKEMR